MDNQIFKNIINTKKIIDELDLSKSNNHYRALKALSTLILAIEALYEIIPNDDKIGSFQMIETFNKYFFDSSYDDKFSKGLQKANELKENFKKLIELLIKYMKQRTDLKENVFEWKSSKKQFGTILKEIKEFLYKFLEANPINDKNNILSQATDIINIARKNDNNDPLKISKNLDRMKSEFHKNIDILNSLNEEQSEYEDELSDEDLEENSEYNEEYENNDFIDPGLLDGAIMGILSDNYMDLKEAPRSFPNFKMKKGVYKINLKDLTAELFSNSIINFENNENHITKDDLYERLSLKPSFKSNSSTAKFLRNLMDAISQMMKALAIETDPDTGDLPLPLAIFKLSLIYDLIALHLGFSIK